MNRKLLYGAQTTNRARLVRANAHLKRALNLSIKEGDDELTQVQIRLSLILWMAWLESSVIWLACHPRVPATDCEDVVGKRTHEQKWKLLLERLRQAQPPARQTRCDTLLDWIKNEVLPYSELRNKLAHGQWAVCLTSTHEKRNPALTARVVSVTKGDILFLKAVAEELVDLTERLIVAPAGFDTEFPKSVARIERSRQTFRGDISWLLTELRRKHRRWLPPPLVRASRGRPSG